MDHMETQFNFSELDIAKSSNEGKNVDFKQFWTIKLYKSKTLKYPKGVYVLEFRTNEGSESVSSYYYHHDLLNESCRKFKEVLEDLNIFGSYIDRSMLQAMIDESKILRKNKDYQWISPDELDSMMKQNELNNEETKNKHRDFEEYVLEMINSFPTVSSGKYDPDESSGIILDTPELRKKFGENVIGVTKYTLMEIFVWDERPCSRKEYRSYNGHDDTLNSLLHQWKDAGLLVKRTELGRLNEWVKNPGRGIDKDRFYLIRCPRVFEVLKKGEGSGANA